MNKEKIVIELGDVYQKTYRMHRTGENGKTVEASIPPPVIDREARKRNLSIDEFTKRFNVQWSYNAFEGLHLTFIERK